MLDTQLDIEAIVKSNPQISPGCLERVESLWTRLDRLGIRETEYRLATPFSSSLRKTVDQAREVRKSR